MSRRSSSKESPSDVARDPDAPAEAHDSADGPSEAKGSAKASEIAEIDTAPIDALLKIAKQQEDLRALLGKAEATREKVSAAVFKRVKADYDKRLDALEAEARPLRQKARQEHARLQPIHDRLGKGVEEARLDKEELEFRHEVGEIPEDTFEERRKVAEELLAQRERDFKEADELKQRFMGVMGPEEPAPASPPPPEPVSARTTELPTSEHLPEPLSDEDLGLAPPPEPEVVEIDDSPTNPGSAEATAYIQSAAMSLPPPISASAAPEGRTMVMRFARFVAEDTSEEFQLGLRTSVGRTPDNDICINNPAVSRRHAVISVAEGGYVVADLKSGNGTYVNDEKIDQRPLVEGDRVKIGPTTFVFHLPE